LSVWGQTVSEVASCAYNKVTEKKKRRKKGNKT
jgi:hypothetical protein